MQSQPRSALRRYGTGRDLRRHWSARAAHADLEQTSHERQGPAGPAKTAPARARWPAAASGMHTSARRHFARRGRPVHEHGLMRKQYSRNANAQWVCTPAFRTAGKANLGRVRGFVGKPSTPKWPRARIPSPSRSQVLPGKSAQAAFGKRSKRRQGSPSHAARAPWAVADGLGGAGALWAGVEMPQLGAGGFAAAAVTRTGSQLGCARCRRPRRRPTQGSRTSIP